MPAGNPVEGTKQQNSQVPAKEEQKDEAKS
jgi:hypothetical protein